MEGTATWYWIKFVLCGVKIMSIISMQNKNQNLRIVSMIWNIDDLEEFKIFNGKVGY